MKKFSERPLKNGGDPRTLPDYLALRKELGKLTHPARPDVSWQQVEKLCLALFEHNGVDLQSAAWYTLARSHTAGPDGMAEGLELLKRLLEGHWSILWPPDIAARRQIILGLGQQLQKRFRMLTFRSRTDLPLLCQIETLLVELQDMLTAKAPEVSSQQETLSPVSEKNGLASGDRGGETQALLQQVRQILGRLQSLPAEDPPVAAPSPALEPPLPPAIAPAGSSAAVTASTAVAIPVLAPAIPSITMPTLATGKVPAPTPTPAATSATVSASAAATTASAASPVPAATSSSLASEESPVPAAISSCLASGESPVPAAISSCLASGESPPGNPRSGNREVTARFPDAAEPQKPPASIFLRPFLAGAVTALLVAGVAQWGWRILQQPDGVERQLTALLTPLPTPAPNEAVQITDSNAVIPRADIWLPRMEQQLNQLNALPVTWRQQYASQLLDRAQRLWPNSAAVAMLRLDWQRQLEGNALPETTHGGWHQGMQQLRALSDRLNALDGQRGKYLTVSELKSEVYNLSESFGRSVPVEEQIRQLAAAEGNATAAQFAQLELHLKQQANSFFLLKAQRQN